MTIMDFRTKGILCVRGGVLHGRLTYPDACNMRFRKHVRCRTTKSLIGPGGGGTVSTARKNLMWIQTVICRVIINYI